MSWFPNSSIDFTEIQIKREFLNHLEKECNSSIPESCTVGLPSVVKYLPNGCHPYKDRFVSSDGDSSLNQRTLLTDLELKLGIFSGVEISCHKISRTSRIGIVLK